MKISIDKLRISPDGEQLCFYGKDEEVEAWLNHHKLETNEKNGFVNFNLNTEKNSIGDYFHPVEKITFMDGFSPNLNKRLHVGHLSNLIIAQALNKFGVNDFNVYIINNVENKDDNYFLRNQFLMEDFGYEPDLVYRPNNHRYKGKLELGKGKFEGTQGITIEDVYIVCIKSDGSTSYFFEDMKLASKLSDTLYITGKEQQTHFNLLKIYKKSKYNQEIKHLPIGHVQLNGGKMSSREGNVVYVDDLIEYLEENIKTMGDKGKLSKNILIGGILEKTPRSDKKLDLKNLLNLHKSSGLYLSYTMARLCSVGFEKHLRPYSKTMLFSSDILTFAKLKSQKTLNPSFFYKYLMALAKKINAKYEKVRIKGNDEAFYEFYPLFHDLNMGMNILGMELTTQV